jgi:hypothetical protein
MSSKYYQLDKKVLLNDTKIIKNKNNIKNIKNLIIPEPKKIKDEKYKPSNYFLDLYNINDNLNSNKANINYKDSDYINKISNNNFISHIYQKNSDQMNKIPFVDLHHNIQTQKGKFLLRNNNLNKIDDIAHFDEKLLESLYCKYKNKDKMTLLKSL